MNMRNPFADKGWDDGVKCMEYGLASNNITYIDETGFIVAEVTGIHEISRECNLLGIPISHIRFTARCRTTDGRVLSSALCLVTIARDKLPPNAVNSSERKDGDYTLTLKASCLGESEETIAALKPQLSKIISMMGDAPVIEGLQNDEILIQPEVLYPDVPAKSDADSKNKNMQPTLAEYAINMILNVDKSMGPYICNDFFRGKSTYFAFMFQPVDGTTAESLDATFENARLYIYYDMNKVGDEFKVQLEPLFNSKGD